MYYSYSVLDSKDSFGPKELGEVPLYTFFGSLCEAAT